MEEAARVAPGPNQVEVRVHAAGLNFHDMMWVMGLLPEEAVESGFAGPTIGMECAGVIERVGAGVTEFAPGDRVIAFGPACFSSHLLTTTLAVAHLPAGMTFESAATIPTTFFTAYYALEHLARLEPGERVLIHGAAGGVGFAAIQYAQLRGAEIFGTAGSEEKRDILRMMGVHHVHDSRSLAFADEILDITGGKGVDVVLNSLAGDAIWENLRVLKPFGRFLELGKRDYFANTKIGLRPFRNNLSYFGIDADQLMEERPELAQRLLRELMTLVADGALKPLPHRSFPIERASEAFRTMQQSRQIGKLVLTMEGVPGRALVPGKADLLIREDGTYLVTGGLTGFGLATAKWLVKKGARHVALLGRRGAATPEASDGIAEMTAAGAKISVFAADVTDESRMAEVIAEIKRDLPPIRGVVHAAMVLDDRIILRLDHDSLHRALDPKIVGAWVLHQATLDLSLDFFVLYSSVTTFMANPGQANYVAGCSYLETLAQYRRSLGLPGLAVSWGAIADVGYVARNPALQDQLFNRIGMRTISPIRALDALEGLITAGATRVAVGNSDWQRLFKSMPSASAPKYSPLVGLNDQPELGGAASDFLETLKAIAPAERGEAMVRRLCQLLGRVIGLSGPQLDVDRPSPSLASIRS
jgi:phthiocerol/phenolphthiocerol synthesis type-I polyketide synthase C